MIRIMLSKKLGELRWTQADLARATGIRPSTINEYYHEFAERVNLEHLDLINALFCEVNPIPVKEAMNQLGMNVGGYRLPLCEISESGRETVRRALEVLR